MNDIDLQPKHDAPTCKVCGWPMVPALAQEYSHPGSLPEGDAMLDTLLCLGCGSLTTHDWAVVVHAWWSQGAGDQAACDDARADERRRSEP